MRKGKKGSGKAKRILLGGSLFVGVFGIAAATTFFAIPQKIIEKDIGGGEPVITEPTGVQKLMGNLMDTLSTGLGATVKTGTLNIAGKDDGHTNVLTFNDTALKFRMDAISIHDIDLVVNAKVDYNSKKRGLDLALVNDELYFNVKNYDAPLDTDAHSWDLKYKVSTASYDDVDGDGNPVTDPETGGILQYEYGKLDWVIEDILAILTDNDIDISFPSLTSLITGSGNSEEGETQSSSSSIDANAILESMNNMEESVVEGYPYFTWNLEIGDVSLPIGIKGTSDYRLSRVDLPAVTVENEVVSQGVYELTDDIDLQLQLDIATNDLEFAVPYDKENYRSLENSLALFEKVATVAGTMQFGLDLDLDLTNGSEGEEATIYRFAKDEVNDAANLKLTGNVDAKGLKLNALDAELTFAQVGGTNGAQNLSAKYLPNGEETDMYVNLNDVLRAKTTKTTLDALIGNIKDNLINNTSSATDPEGASEAQNTEVQIFSAESAIGQAIQAVKDSDFLSGLNNGVYDSALDFVDYIDSNDNWIKIGLDLDPIGITGKVTVTIGKDSLDKNAVMADIDPLLTIEFDGIEFASFGVDGTLSLVDYSTPSITETEAATYQEMLHLNGLGDQIVDIVNEKAATIDLDGSFFVNGSTSADGSTRVGASFEGKVGFSAEDRFVLGTQITVREYEEKFLQDHHVKLDVAPAEGEDAEGSIAYFSYDSLNDTIDENHTNPKTSDPVSGHIATADAMHVIGNIIDWATGSLDNRFDRIARAISKPGDTSLLSQLTSGNYFALADLHVLKSVSLGATDVFVINAEKLGLDKDITISLDFDANDQLENINISATFGDDLAKASVLDLNLGLSSGVLSEDTRVFEDHDVAHYDDYGSLLNLAEYAVNTTTVGAVNHDGHGQSTYGLEANVDLVLGDYALNAVSLGGVISVDGAQLQIAAGMDNLPVIKGINGPEDDKYFRGHEYEGYRAMGFYYYADGLEVNDEVMMTRDSSYGRLRNVKDSVRMGKETFTNDIGGWLLQYLLGVNSEFFAENEPETTTDPVEETSSVGLPLSKAIHVMDIFHGIDYVAPSEESTKANWSITLDLAKLGFGLLGDAVLTIDADTVKDTNNNSFKTLTGLKVEVNIALAGKLKVITAVVDARLTNVSNGVYTNVWNAANVPGYFTYFRPENGTPEAYSVVAARNHADTETVKLTAGNLF